MMSQKRKIWKLAKDAFHNWSQIPDLSPDLQFKTKLKQSHRASATFTVKETVGGNDGADMTVKQLVSGGCGFYMRALLAAWASLLQSP